ncbi:MAG: GWxTD domain-containing protein, partial [Ignavibacterium sp.]|nr:GWxTD domain-containing protein [Ignavibacterium sp.]
FRKFDSHTIELNNFELTRSVKDFYTGFIEFFLPKDSFQINISFNDLTINKRFYYDSKKINLLDDKVDTNSWLLVNSNYKRNNYQFIVDIFGDAIPHSSNNYDLLLSSNNQIYDLQKITINDKDSLISELSFEIIKSANLNFSSEKSQIKLDIKNQIHKQSEDKIPKIEKDYLIIKNINQKLYEGDYSIKLLDSKDKLLNEIPIKVKWFYKPKSLEDINFALEMIELIAVDENLKSNFVSEIEKKKKLFNYWKSKDPTPLTSFNELMNEFYSRVDYAVDEFMSISQRNGAKTDRGKIYIMHGKPDKVERVTNTDGKVIEQWFYYNPQRVFQFIDSRGDGNFKSMK